MAAPLPDQRQRQRNQHRLRQAVEQAANRQHANSASNPATITGAPADAILGSGVWRTRSEGRLVLQALRNGYPFDDDTRQRMLDSALAVLDAPAPRDRLMAVKVLATLDSLNVQREKAASDAGRPQTVNIDARVQIALAQLAAMPAQTLQDAPESTISPQMGIPSAASADAPDAKPAS